MVDLALIERETVVSTNDAEDFWNVCTASPVWIRKLDAIGAELVKVYQGGTHRHYRLASNMLTMRKPIQLSDEERARRANILRSTVHANLAANQPVAYGREGAES